MWFKLMLIGLGGGFGSILRYLLGGWVQARFSEGSFPLGTLFINVSGCLAIGFLGTLFTGPSLVREEYRVAILVGILGGYTTYSTFGRETFMLANDNELWYAGLNIVLSNALGLIAVWIGHHLSQKWFGV